MSCGCKETTNSKMWMPHEHFQSDSTEDHDTRLVSPIQRLTKCKMSFDYKIIGSSLSLNDVSSYFSASRCQFRCLCRCFDHSLLLLIHSVSVTHTVFSPWSRHQWGVCTLHRCWHRACRSTWCTRVSHPSSRTSSPAGCHGSSSSRSVPSWWR